MIRIDLDLPEFDKEISLNIVIKKDGEVISSSSLENNIPRKISSFPAKGTDKVKNSSPSVKVSSSDSNNKLIGGGNMMDLSL